MKEKTLIAECADETLDSGTVAAYPACVVPCTICRTPTELADEALDGDASAGARVCTAPCIGPCFNAPAELSDEALDGDASAGAIICMYCQRCQHRTEAELADEALDLRS